MQPNQNTEKRRNDGVLLDNLQDDLFVLENAWNKKKMSSQKAAQYLAEMVQSVRQAAKSAALDEFVDACNDFEKTLINVQGNKEELGERQWALISDLIGLVRNSLDGGRTANADLKLRSERNDKENLSASHQGPPAGGENRLTLREEKQMVKSLQANAKELLQKAQEALVSGNGEDAKELAIQAAELLARIEMEEAKKKEKGLRADMELAVHEEAEADETLARIKEEKNDRETEINQLNNRLSEARDSFTELQRSCQNSKEQIETIEAEIGRLQEERKKLLEQFHEALPARDAAERECLRLKNELEKLTPEMELISDSARAAEDQLAKLRQRREAIEAEIGNLSTKIGS